MIGRFGASAFIAMLLFAVGCSDRASQVTGHVTCEGKPVVGSIVFTPAGEGEGNTGPGVSDP